MIHFFGHLTVGRIQSLRRLHEYSKRTKQIELLLKEWSIKKEVKNRTMEYYKNLWNNRSGVNILPQSFSFLPEPLQKEVTCDIFWEALRHSTFFSGTEISLKRAVSMYMKSEFYLPGDYIYKVQHYKTKMIYIVSGILQVTLKLVKCKFDYI